MLNGNGWNSERHSQQDALKGSSSIPNCACALLQRSSLAASLMHERAPSFTKSKKVLYSVRNISFNLINSDFN